MSKILIIEDNDLERNSLFEFLSEGNYDVMVAEDGKIGMRLLQQHQFDVIIADIFMPEQDGLQTILESKELRSNIKIIAVSGGGRFGHIEYLDISTDFGADMIMEKPLIFGDLLETIKELTRK